MYVASYDCSEITSFNSSIHFYFYFVIFEKSPIHIVAMLVATYMYMYQYTILKVLIITS